MSPEITNGIFAISGAVIGALIAGLIAWAIQANYRSRKSIKVLISKPRPLIDIDESVKDRIIVSMHGQEVETLTSIDYYVVNTGNEALENIDINFSFSGNIRILGGNCPKLNFTTESVEDFAMYLEKNSSCNIKANFLNPGEEAKGNLLIKNVPETIDAHFRQPNVKFKIEKNYDPAHSKIITDILFDAAKSNFFIDTYFRIALPAYRAQRNRDRI